MYILYLDESGTHSAASYFVLAGLAVPEVEIEGFTQDLDNLQQEHFPLETEPVFFHARTLRIPDTVSLPPPFDQTSQSQRREIKERVYETLRNRPAVLFGCAIEKQYAQERGQQPYEWAFEHLILRFDLFLNRINQTAAAENREEQRGIVVLAESNYENTIARLAGDMRQELRASNRYSSIVDIPFFAPARDSRMLQYADFCANAIYGCYDRGLTGDFDKIASKFARDENAVYGLRHLSND